jgi:hypothetical protein
MPLTTSLISFYELGEAAGATRVDSVVASGNDLTDHATVAQVVGKVGNAAGFTNASSQYLSHADNASLSTGNIDFEVCAWVYITGSVVMPVIMSKYTDTTHREYFLYYDNFAQRFSFIVYNSSGTQVGIVAANTFGMPSASTWYLVNAYYDSVHSLVGISVNAGAADTSATSGTPADTTAVFNIGAANANEFWDGRIDQAGFWKKVLSGAERTTLYNGGSGLSYAAMSTSDGTTAAALVPPSTMAGSGAYTIFDAGSGGDLVGGTTLAGVATYAFQGGGTGSGALAPVTTLPNVSIYRDPLYTGAGSLGPAAILSNAATFNYTGVGALVPANVLAGSGFRDLGTQYHGSGVLIGSGVLTADALIATSHLILTKPTSDNTPPSKSMRGLLG